MGSAGIRERRAFVLIHMFFAKYINSKVWGWRANSHSGFKVTRCRPLCKALSSSSSHYKKAYGYFSRKTHHISFSCLTYDFKKNVSLTERSTWIWIFPNGTSLGFCHSVKLLRNPEERGCTYSYDEKILWLLLLLLLLFQQFGSQ